MGCGYFSVAGLDEGKHSGPAQRLEPSQAEILAAVLSRAFYDDPRFRYGIPDEQARVRLLPGLFRSFIRASQLNGEIYTTREIDGGVVWTGPGNALSLGHMMRGEWLNLSRCIDLGVRLDEVHQQLVREPHRYLLLLGVEPSKQSWKVTATLIEPLLARADSDGLPCYLETFNERDLPIYKRHGFRIAGGGKISTGGPDFWAMIRTPGSATRTSFN